MNNASLPIKSSVGGKKYDLVKFILAMMIFMLHSAVFPKFIYPVFRTAVPLFFMISSYFFFSKTTQTKDTKARWAMLIHFTKRNFFLLLFWTTIFIIPICMHRGWLTKEFSSGLLSFVRGLVFGSTFVASWFLSANIVATAIVYFLSYRAKMKDWMILGVGIVLYWCCCLCSNYSCLWMESSYADYYKAYCQIMGTPYLSFVAAVIWIAFGKFFASNRIQWKPGTLKLTCVLCFMLLYVEYYIVNTWFVPSNADDCYFMLLILCPVLMQLLITQKDISIRHPKIWRKMSIIIFCTHGTFLWIARHFFHSSLSKVVAFLACSMIGVIILLLQKRIKTLKYAT